MSQPKSGLQYDELGFLIGLKQTGRDVAKIDRNVEQIISLLERALKEREKPQPQNELPQPKLSALAQALIDAQREAVSSEDLIREKRQSTTAINQLLETVEDLISESARPSNSKAKPKRSAIQNDPVTIDSQESLARELGADRQRDANGRFTGSGQESKSALGKITQTLSTALSNGLNGSHQGVDPTVDAINEVAAVLSPVKRAAGFMLRPLSGLMKSRKRSEPLPREQEQHNRNQLKLLQRIADNMASKGGLLGSLGKLLGGGGGLLGGLLGSLFGKGGKGLSKLLKFGKGIPVLGALLTALSFSDWDNKNTNEKGGAVGSAAGGTIGAIAGSFFGPVGTVIGGLAGAWIGDKLGSTVAPYFKDWTDSLKAADLPGMLKSGWDSFIDIVSKAFNLTPAGQSAGLLKDVYDWGKQKLFGGAGGESLLFRKKYGGQGLDEPETSGSAPASYGGAVSNSLSGIRKIITAKKGRSNVLELNDGSVVKRTGNRNWRNNNPGNIEYYKGKFAPKMGAIGTDGRFAIFPDYATGRNAKEQLIFNEAKYKNKTLTAAIAKYAPKIENNTARYQRAVLAAVGGQNKRMSDYSAAERKKIMDAMEHEEGYRVGTVEVIKAAPSASKAPQQPAGPAASQQQPVANAKKAIAQQAESMMRKVGSQASALSTTPAEVLKAPRANTLASYTAPKINTAVEPVKEFLTAAEPQRVQIVNQNSANINQNVSDRMLAHAITGGLGMGANSWDA